METPTKNHQSSQYPFGQKECYYNCPECSNKVLGGVVQCNNQCKAKLDLDYFFIGKIKAGSSIIA
jgi:hypothetical protein